MERSLFSSQRGQAHDQTFQVARGLVLHNLDVLNMMKRKSVNDLRHAQEVLVVRIWSEPRGRESFSITSAYKGWRR